MLEKKMLFKVGNKVKGKLSKLKIQHNHDLEINKIYTVTRTSYDYIYLDHDWKAYHIERFIKVINSKLPDWL